MTAIKVVIVSGLSGAGKGSILRVFEDLGFDAVDNPPIPIVPALVARSSRPLAIGLDARSQGFDPGAILAIIDDLKAKSDLAPELIYARADEAVLLRRFTETRRRHPMAPQGRVLDGIILEASLTHPLLDRSDWVLDTSGLALPSLRQRIEQRFQNSMGQNGGRRTMTVAIVSFAFPAGLPREADMVFDARFLRNPHYIESLRDKTGHEADVAEYIEADADFARFFSSISDLCSLVIPRFVAEGKKYATVAIGCTGGRHRSVHIANLLGARLSSSMVGAAGTGAAGADTRPEGEHDWSILVSHRDLIEPPLPTERTTVADVDARLRASNKSWSL